MNQALVAGASGELTDAEKREELIALVVDSVPSEHSKRAYRIGLEQFFIWWAASAPGVVFSRPLLQRFRSSLAAAGKSASTINQRLAPVRKLADEASAVGLLPGEIRRVKGAKQLGVRTGNWLTGRAGRQLLILPVRETLKGKRDAALLSLLVSAGLRREELAGLRIEDIQQRDNR